MGFTMDMLDLEKLLEHADMVDKISKDVVDGQGYSAVTKSINESVSQNTDTDVGKVLSNGDKINDKLNLDLLESQVNGALGLKKEIIMDNASKIAGVPSNAGKPAVGVDTADKFQQAVAVKQSDFVNANTEHQVSATADEKGVVKNADDAMKVMRKGAESEKKSAFPDGKQEVPAVTESGDATIQGIPSENVGDSVDVETKGESAARKSAKSAIAASEVGKPNDEWTKGATAFKTFVASLKDGKNDAPMNAVLEAFEVISKRR